VRTFFARDLRRAPPTGKPEVIFDDDVVIGGDDSGGGSEAGLDASVTTTWCASA
jgi:hypothetical protein